MEVTHHHYHHHFIIIITINVIDSTNPGIGVPSTAASGAMAAAAIMSTEQHLQLLKKIKMP